jgi:Toprim domain-containing protein
MSYIKGYLFRLQQRDHEQSLSVVDDHGLSFSDIEQLTSGRLGTFSLPCPYCAPNKRYSSRFQVKRASYSKASYHCFYCGRSGSVHADGPIDPGKEEEAVRLAAEHDAERTTLALKWWDEAEKLPSIALQYFAARKIHELPPNMDGVLRWHPSCPFGRGHPRQAVMLALFRDALSDEARAIHRTVVTVQGTALGRMSLGPIKGAVIKLWQLASGGHLVIGEGIETTLAAAGLIFRKQPLKPAWAGTVAMNVAMLPVIPNVRRLIILADNDESGTGQLAARQVYWRWKAAKQDAEILMPRKTGADFNDVAREAKR